MNGLVYYAAAAALWTGLAAQLRSARENWRDPLNRALCSVIFLAGFCFALGAPPTIGLLNHTIGVPNAAACVTYGAVNAFSAASLVLIVHWRGAGGPERVRRISLAWLITYAVVIALQTALFVAGETPVERRVDFDTYYATTPFIREMIVLYLLAHMVAAVTTTILCWRWTHRLSGWTKKSLATLVLGWLCHSAYSIVKVVALAGRWSGHRWDDLSTVLAPLLVTVGAALTASGVILPLFSAHIDSLVVFFRLGPLFRLVAGRNNGQVALSWRTLGDVELRLTRRRIAILDGLKDVSVHFDEAVRESAYRQAIDCGSTATEAAVIGDAAMVAVAAHSRRNRASRPDPATLNNLALDTIAGFTPTDSAQAGQQPLDTRQPSLVRMSQAIGAAIVERAVRAQLTQSQRV